MSSSSLLEDRDLAIGAALTCGGILSMALGLLHRPGALQMMPAMDGCLTVGIVGLGLLLAAQVPYQKALLTMAPIVVIQLLATRVYATPALAALGLEAIVYGMIGVALGLRARAASAPADPLPQSRPHRAPSRALASSAVHLASHR